jgi:sulfur transfer protein SufE
MNEQTEREEDIDLGQKSDSVLEKILQNRLQNTLNQIIEIEKRIPELEKDYNTKMQELEKCKDKTRLGILRTFLKEKRLFIKQQQEARLELVKQIQLILKIRKEAD